MRPFKTAVPVRIKSVLVRHELQSIKTIKYVNISPRDQIEVLLPWKASAELRRQTSLRLRPRRHRRLPSPFEIFLRHHGSLRATCVRIKQAIIFSADIPRWWWWGGGGGDRKICSMINFARTTTRTGTDNNFDKIFDNLRTSKYLEDRTFSMLFSSTKRKKRSR